MTERHAKNVQKHAWTNPNTWDHISWCCAELTATWAKFWMPCVLPITNHRKLRRQILSDILYRNIPLPPALGATGLSSSPLRTFIGHASWAMWNWNSLKLHIPPCSPLQLPIDCCWRCRSFEAEQKIRNPLRNYKQKLDWFHRIHRNLHRNLISGIQWNQESQESHRIHRILKLPLPGFQ